MYMKTMVEENEQMARRFFFASFIMLQVFIFVGGVFYTLLVIGPKSFVLWVGGLEKIELCGWWGLLVI